MAKVLDVAAYVLTKQGEMSTMKLQKLCYYSQGWSLAWDEKPLFGESIQAWANGPVSYDLFLKHRGRFWLTRDDATQLGDADRLTEDERATVDGVLDGYGQLSGQELSDKTHMERPWVEARNGLPLGAPSSQMLSLDTMQDYFAGLTAS
jgi:uncharacterized phage-associated protein